MTNLHLKKLVVLNMSHSEISEDWGFGPLKMATELKVLDLSYCTLRTTPDLSAFKGLEILILAHCGDLEEIHPTIKDIKTLVSLKVNYCWKLKELPREVGRMEELRELIIQETSIREIPISRGFLTKLETLNASWCTLLTRLPKSLGSLMSLTQLNLSHTNIEELPESIGSLKKLETLDASFCVLLLHMPNSIGDLESLSCLNLTYCHKLAQLPDSIGSLVSLQRLLLSRCHSLKQIPDLIGKLTSLTELLLESTDIEELLESIGSLKELKILDASYCKSLARIPNSIGNSTSLSHLDLKECHKLARLPDSMGSLMSLQQLLLSRCHLLKQIPDSIGKLTSLTKLLLESTAIEELPTSIGNMQNIRMLDISGTPIKELLDNPGILAELQEFKASGWKNLEWSPSNNGQLVSPNNLGLDKLKKLSELRSRVLALVFLKRPKSLVANNSTMDYQTTDFEHFLKRSRPFGISDEVNNLPVNILPVSYNCPSLDQSSYSLNDLPKNVVITLSQGSLVKSMDFHPMQQILLLVGTNMGDVVVWEVDSGARIALRKFKIWDLGTCSMALQASLAIDYTTSVNRVMWSPNGILFGVAYSKHMVHIYSYHGGDDIRNHLEIEAHVGSVNDLEFSNPSKRLCVVTCGEDKTIKVWDAVIGAKLLAFEGHEAPVYSICPHKRENIQFIFSTATDGKIKTWFYDNMRSRANYDAPGHSSTVMTYSDDGSRLFSCGTNTEGESYLVEWNESEGTVKRTYHGLRKRSGGFVQFDSAKNRFLAAGDEFMVKFWEMDNNNLLTSTNADGELPASPCIRFNKEGILLAVSTSDNRVKILANADGIRLLRTVNNRPFDASRITPGPLMKDSESMANMNPIIADESGDKSRIWKPTEINEPSQCRSIKLPDNSTATRVSRLIYTNSGGAITYKDVPDNPRNRRLQRGGAILALSSNGVHKLWKWQKSDQNLTGRATTGVVPRLWQPSSGILMTNDTNGTDPQDAVPSFAVSKNDSYLISASGGLISLFNMMTFKTMTTFSPPPPPNNDVVAIGMEDSTIQIYSGQVDEIQTKLKGHRRIIKGFTFSTSLNVLVSSGADSQTMTTFMPQPPPTTFLAFYPQDNNIIAIGMEDSSIHIYNVRVDEFKANLKGHQKRITGLAFSNVLNVLVSSSADSQLCVWSTDGWEKQASKFLQMPTGQGAAPFADTRVQFHVDQIHLLVVHEIQIATCKAPELECLKQWDTREASFPITDATYSCNGQSIYVSFEDGSISVLSASTLRLRCRINPATYIPPNPNLRVYPLVIAAHPSQPNQFALGLIDGSVYVLEPLDSEGEWASSPSVENGAEPSTTSGATSSDQPQR
ncbi:protein TPR3 [Eucalyptus grandis]|uniref:protein TPR3 n=1 Tax=Eucalyptus grandis TaxID=71139 RepID=UPI00192EA45E|nr:protein TPR3 [Eucalyptus grandis]